MQLPSLSLPCLPACSSVREGGSSSIRTPFCARCFDVRLGCPLLRFVKVLGSQSVRASERGAARPKTVRHPPPALLPAPPFCFARVSNKATTEAMGLERMAMGFLIRSWVLLGFCYAESLAFAVG